MHQFYGHLEKCVLSAGKTKSVKFPFFWECRFYFHGRADFSDCVLLFSIWSGRAPSSLHLRFQHLKGGIKRDKLHGTNWFLQNSAVSCVLLGKSSVSSGFLQRSAPPKCCNCTKMVKNGRKISEKPTNISRS